MHLRIFMKGLLAHWTKGPLLKVFYSLDPTIENHNSRVLLSHFIRYFEHVTGITNHMPTEMNRFTILATAQSYNESPQSFPIKVNGTNEKSDEDQLNNRFSILLSILNDIECMHSARIEPMSLYSIDKRCCDLLDVLSPNEILILLNQLTKIVPLQLVSTQFYERSLKKLLETLSASSDSYQIVNLIFLASFKRKASAPEINQALQHLEDIKNLSLTEKSILTAATFKSGVKLDRSKIRTVEATILNEFEASMRVPGFLVSLTKAVRLSGPSPEFSLNPISERILRYEGEYGLSTAAPLLALCVETRTIDERLIDRLVAESIADIAENGKLITHKYTHCSIGIRLKDVDRLLWALATLNRKLTENQYTEIKNFIRLRFSSYCHSPETLTGTLLWLWMLGHKDQEIIERCFRYGVFQPILSTISKFHNRLVLLLSCIKIEAPDIEIPLDHSNQRCSKMIPSKQIKQVASLCKCFAEHLTLSDIKIEYPVNGIRTPGISAKHKTLGWIHLDIVDEAPSRQDTSKPNGYLELKRRLVERLGYKSIVLCDVANPEVLYTRIEELIHSL